MYDLHGGVEQCVLIVRFPLRQRLRRNPALKRNPTTLTPCVVPGKGLGSEMHATVSGVS